MADLLTSEGLEIENLQTTADTILTELRANVDPVIGNDPLSVIEAQEAAIIAAHKREACEVIQHLADALNPDNAEGSLLENICAITGTAKRGPLKSTFFGARKVTATLAAGATLPLGSIFSQLDHPEIRAVTTESKTNALGVQADVLIAAEAEDSGPLAMVAGTMSVRVSGVTGWLGVTNTADALIGRDSELDPALRLRREVEIAAPGSANVNAIRADVLRVTEEDGSQHVLECLVLENDTDVYDVKTGLPRHSIEVIVWDAGLSTNALIAAAIFTKAAGVRTMGSIVVSVVDDYGYTHEIRFSRVTEKALKLELTYKRNTSLYAGDTATKALLALASQKGYEGIESLPQRPGGSAQWSAYVAILKDQPGVKAITSARLVLSPGAFAGTFTDIDVDFREIVTLTTSNITLLE